MRFDRIIKNGMIVDGTGQRRFRGDIGIRDGLITEIGKLHESDAREIIDATGLIVAPGFIDLHTHYDAQLFWDPYCSISAWHGVTSVIIGNCGLGFAPVRPADRDRAMQSMTRIEAIPYESMKRALPWDWVSFPEFLNSVDRAPKAMNVLAYVGAGPLLTWVLGTEAAKAGRKPTNAEHVEIRRVLSEAMDAGACGWSTQYTPPDGNFALQRDYDGTPMVTDLMHPDTLHELAKVLRERNEGLIQMTHMTGDRNRDHAMFEKLAEISGRPVVFTAVAALDADASNHRLQLAWLKGCHERGLRVIGHGFTTNAGYNFRMDEWNLFDNSEAWAEATTGNPEERKKKLADHTRREALKKDVPNVVFYLGDVVIKGPKLEKNKQWIGQTLTAIAAKTGKHIVDIFLDMTVEENLETDFYAPQVSSNNNGWLKEVVDDRWIIFGASDGGAHTRFITNGRFTTEAIVKYVREHSWISLEEAHWRLSALPALAAGLKDRGTLTLGAAADIVVYDFDELKILDVEVAHDFPGNEWRRIQRASGYRFILVNGEITIRDGQETGTWSGRLLRHGYAAPRPSSAAAAA
jgi:N-acyl-D-aspartate/D-glutamate deacylase